MSILASLFQLRRSQAQPAPVIAPPSRRSCWTVFAIIAAVTLGYACYTQHAWEDYYITYRASKNLATGHGLTFTHGERVHSFTSPLGVLLPALASVMTGNQSDDAALWIFRCMSIAAFAGAGVLFWRIARGLFANVFPAVFLVLLLATDAKSLECVTNGMETAFVLLFLAWTLWALFIAERRRAMHLGLAWAGMMWSRPDSFVYIAGLSLGVLLLGRFAAGTGGRKQFFRDCCIGAAITTVVYGPWLVWAWWYYGSPVPHTILAKSLWVPRPTFSNVLRWIVEFPLKIARDGASLPTTFMPPYAVNSGWPMWQIRISWYLSAAVALVWLIPAVRWQARVTSLAFTLGHFFLTYFANFPAPWYIPTLTALGLVTLAIVVGQLVSAGAGEATTARAKLPRSSRIVVAAALLIPLGALGLTLCTARLMRFTQIIIENEHRRPMAEWIKANSPPRDTVVVECLGYMGFYTNLKMYDYPGLSSPEVVDVLRRTKTRADYTAYFSEIITALEPDWVVLRGGEAKQVRLLDRDVLTRYYRLERIFDTRAKIDAIRFLPGRHHLEFDSHFEVYRRNPQPEGLARLKDHTPVAIQPITMESLIEKKTWTGPAYESNGNIVAHAPSLLTVAVPPGIGAISGEFGFFPGSFEKPDSTFGAIFTVNVVTADGTRTKIFSRQLNPREVEADRGTQRFDAPITVSGATMAEFAIDPPPYKSNAFDWTYWTKLTLDTPKK